MPTEKTIAAGPILITHCPACTSPARIDAELAPYAESIRQQLAAYDDR